ncbi:MAG: hypothetical protein L6R40_008755 [Gallowayella cf. fulva]|nr:MAG: hypothetical protein L6R40_008755 [Xanthomendoza cf. fulva]
MQTLQSQIGNSTMPEEDKAFLDPEFDSLAFLYTESFKVVEQRLYRLRMIHNLAKSYIRRLVEEVNQQINPDGQDPSTPDTRLIVPIQPRNTYHLPFPPLGLAPFRGWIDGQSHGLTTKTESPATKLFVCLESEISQFVTPGSMEHVVKSLLEGLLTIYSRLNDYRMENVIKLASLKPAPLRVRAWSSFTGRPSARDLVVREIIREIDMLADTRSKMWDEYKYFDRKQKAMTKIVNEAWRFTRHSFDEWRLPDGELLSSWFYDRQTFLNDVIGRLSRGLVDWEPLEEEL